MNTKHPGSDLFARIAGEARRLERRPVDRSVDHIATRCSLAAYIADMTGLAAGYIEGALPYCGPDSAFTGCRGSMCIADAVARRVSAIREERLS